MQTDTAMCPLVSGFYVKYLKIKFREKHNQIFLNLPIVTFLESLLHIKIVREKYFAFVHKIIGFRLR